jgi:chaperone required for assembly of F1-ATPase
MQGKPKRFYQDASIAKASGGFQIMLDGRVLKTVARKPLTLPNEALAGLVLSEWKAAVEVIDAEVMTATRLANIALDRVPIDRALMAEQMLMYADTDLLCHRAREEDLHAKQVQQWDPVLHFLEEKYGIKMVVVTGVLPVDQPKASVAAMAALLDQADDFAFAAMAMLVPLLGSILLALAVWKKGVSLDDALAASRLDEDYQQAHWGKDDEMESQWQGKLRDLRVCASWLSACEQRVSTVAEAS